jgi:hypothetical protein
MASSGKRKTTMAKLTRERKLIERRLEKQARKEARKASAGDPAPAHDDTPAVTDEEPETTAETRPPTGEPARLSAR